jgi:CRISPR-associated protein Csx16
MQTVQPKTWIVTRHTGALVFLARRGFFGAHVSHLDTALVRSGDTVIGNLPLSVIARLQRAHAKYWHLCVEVTREDRGQELSADQLESLGACIRRFHVVEVA